MAESLSTVTKSHLPTNNSNYSLHCNEHTDQCQLRPAAIVNKHADTIHLTV